MRKNLGQRIRQLRKEKGLTLVEIANRTGVAQATLSRIETGTMMGTVESHEKISEALGVGLSELYTGVDRRYEEIAHLHKEDSRKVTHHNKSFHVELLTTENFKKKITPLLVTLQGNGQTPIENNERGVEKFVFVLEGEAKVRVDQKEFMLKPDETLYFDASLPHQFINDKAKSARLLITVSPSKI